MICTIYTIRRYQVEEAGRARSIYTVTAGGRRWAIKTPQDAATWVRRLVH